MAPPVIEGALIRLVVDHLPGDRDPKPLWRWCSRIGLRPGGDRLWQAFLRRFDLEHTFRLFKQALGWTVPKVRDPAAADRWTWLMIAAMPSCVWPGASPKTCAAPGNDRPRPGRLTPARVRRGFRNIRGKTAQAGRCTETRQGRPWTPARVEKPPPCTRHDVGKTTKRGRC